MDLLLKYHNFYSLKGSRLYYYSLFEVKESFQSKSFQKEILLREWSKVERTDERMGGGG